MNCHACKAPMALDRFGHPVHDGLCPGYPPVVDRRRTICPWCEVPVVTGNMAMHHRRCTRENPVGPAPHSQRVRTCPVCTLPHSPVCQREARRWPLAPLLAALGTPPPEGWPNRLGVNSERWGQWRELGLTDEAADREACRAGFHPASIWPGWFDAGITPVDAAKASGRAWRHMWLADEATKSTTSDQEAAA